MMRNEMMQEENIYSRWITLSGQVEESWVKTPKRFIEAIDLNDPDRDEGVVFKSGIKILSNKNTQTEEDDEVWVTIEQK